MERQAATREFTRLLAAGGELDPWPAALLLASALQGRDVAPAAETERLALREGLRRHFAEDPSLTQALAGTASPAQTASVASALGHWMSGVMGFHGNVGDYYDPRNSFPDQVLSRRLGIPVSLGLLYRALAAPLGLSVHLLGFPGHVLLRVGDPASGALLDPFSGQLLEPADCEQLLRRLNGSPVSLRPAFFEVLGGHEQLQRLLGNLKQIYLAREAFDDALLCCEWLLLIDPRAPQEMLDKALLLERLECYSAARASFRHFLLLHPGHRAAPAVRARLQRFGRGGQPRLH